MKEALVTGELLDCRIDLVKDPNLPRLSIEAKPARAEPDYPNAL